ncbi:MAG: uracil-DNA glycosylase [Galactobacter sp.]
MNFPAKVMPTSLEIQQDPTGWRDTWAQNWRDLGVAEDWLPVLLSLDSALGRIGDGLATHLTNEELILPRPELVLRSLTTAPRDVRVLIVGQDPYPTPGHPIGLSFAVESTVRPLPRSLNNIRKELQADVNATLPDHGDLSTWVDQGVMLLNRSLTVTAGQAGSHAGLGWSALTDAVVGHLGSLPGPPVAILWGRQAQQLKPLLGSHPVIESAHPSPLSASRGFFGSRPFSRANEALIGLGASPVDWSLT